MTAAQWLGLALTCALFGSLFFYLGARSAISRRKARAEKISLIQHWIQWRRYYRIYPRRDLGFSELLETREFPKAPTTLRSLTRNNKQP